MKNNSQTLIVGIGSDFGDDQLGIFVAQQLAAQFPAGNIRVLRSPLNLLDCLEGIERLHVVDACRGEGPAGDIVRFDWPTTDLEEVRFQGTHDFPIVAALHLAERLHRLPPHVTIWAAVVADTTVQHALLAPLSPLAAAAAEALIACLAAEVAGASVTPQASSSHA